MNGCLKSAFAGLRYQLVHSAENKQPEQFLWSMKSCCCCYNENIHQGWCTHAACCCSRFSLLQVMNYTNAYHTDIARHGMKPRVELYMIYLYNLKSPVMFIFFLLCIQMVRLVASNSKLVSWNRTLCKA